MFGNNKKTLIIVYKDELLMNQLKKLIETHDDTENKIIGTKDDSISVVSWTEKVWLANKKAGNIQGKILFLDQIKGTDKLIPVLDIKLNEYGVKFGWAGNQAVLYAEPKDLLDRKQYDEFLSKLESQPVPEYLKTAKESVVATGLLPAVIDNKESSNDKKAKIKIPKILKPAHDVIEAGADAIEKVGDQIATKSEELFRDKKLMKTQMLFYGVVELYNNYLEDFMNH